MNAIYAYDSSLISPDTAFERPSSVVDAYINPQNNGKGGTPDIVPSDFQELSKDKVNLKFGSNIDKTVIYGEVTKAVVKKPTTSTTTTTDKEKQEKEKQEKERQEKEKQDAAAKQEAAKQQELDRQKKEKERLEKERQREIERQKELERQRKQNANSNRRN